MFTGLITDVGTVKHIEGERYIISCRYPFEDLTIGASICCDGCCLTAVGIAHSETENMRLFSVDVSNETKECTTLGAWQLGQEINLEKSLRLGDEMGGHIVTGHVDGVADIIAISEEGGSKKFRFQAPTHLSKYIASKGSVALSGTSLTVNAVEDNEFEVNLIPHTQDVTTWGRMSVGDKVNIEIDLLARYVARLQQAED